MMQEIRAQLALQKQFKTLLAAAQDHHDDQSQNSFNSQLTLTGEVANWKGTPAVVASIERISYAVARGGITTMSDDEPFCNDVRTVVRAIVPGLELCRDLRALVAPAQNVLMGGVMTAPIYTPPAPQVSLLNELPMASSHAQSLLHWLNERIRLLEPFENSFNPQGGTYPTPNTDLDELLELEDLLSDLHLLETRDFPSVDTPDLSEPLRRVLVLFGDAPVPKPITLMITSVSTEVTGDTGTLVLRLAEDTVDLRLHLQAMRNVTVSFDDDHGEPHALFFEAVTLFANDRDLRLHISGIGAARLTAVSLDRLRQVLLGG